MKAKKQQLYDWYSLAKTCQLSLVSSTMYLPLCLHEFSFLCFPYILVDKVVVSAILFDQKKLTDQMLYDASVLQQNKMSNMRNETQMIKHSTYF